MDIKTGHHEKGPGKALVLLYYEGTSGYIYQRVNWSMKAIEDTMTAKDGEVGWQMKPLHWILVFPKR